MTKLLRYIPLIVLILLPSLASAQVNVTGKNPAAFPGVPSGSCTTQQMAVNTANADLYDCLAGVWTKVGSSSGAGVSSVDLTVPSWLSVTGNPVTTSGTLAVAPTAAQSAHQVIGTCNAATTFAPCTLVLADLPATVAPLASPTFTGVPAAPTAAAATNTTQLATTAFVQTHDTTAKTVQNTTLDRTNLINNYPAAPQTDTNDTWLASNVVCVATVKCPFVTHVTFPAAATSGTIDGTHTGATAKWLFNLTGSGGPTLTYALNACASANYTAGVDATTLPICSSGTVVLWSTTAATVTIGQISTGYGIEVWATAGGTAGTFIVSKIMGGNSAGGTATGTGVIACGATCTSGAWVIYPSITYSAATAGNTITTTGFYVPYI